jgi:hypothetical protein
MIRIKCPGAEMTSQQKSDIDGRDEPAGAAAAQQQGSDTLAKSYRYLRLAMVGLLLCLAAAVLYQSWRQGNLLGSVSAYYYTPAQAFFVAGLVGLGACMIALRGTNLVEDAALNLGGVFAAIVAIVPTGRDADYRAAVRACREAGTPLLTDKASTGLDCPTVQALEDATKANVDNNLFGLLVVGAIALLVSLVVAWRDGTLNRQADRDAKRTKRNFLWGFGVALVLWLALLTARLASLQWVIDNGHWIAAVFLFVCVLAVVLANAGRVESKQSGDDSQRQSAVKESLDAARGLIAVRERRDSYILIARGTLLIAAVTLALWGFTDLLTLFWVEAAVFLFFMAFWAWQTFELERSTEPAGVPRRPPATSTSTRPRSPA